MSRDVHAKAHSARNEALVEAMLLAASADGELRPVELEMLIARVVERPEFDGTSATELKALVETAAQRLASAKTLEAVLASLRERLPAHRDRMLAFGLACAVALADHAAKPEELGLLKTFQAALGISEDEVSKVFETVQSGGSLSEVVGEPIDRLYAEAMVLVSTADGLVHEKELLSMFESMAGDPVFRDVSLTSAEVYLKEAVASLSAQGASSRLAVLARGLTTRPQRLKAYELALRIANADGQPSAGEQRMLGLLQATFGLADDEVARIETER